MEPTQDELAQRILLPKQYSSSPEPISSELEEILSDSELPCFQRIGSAIMIELNILFRIAGPAVIVYLLNNVTSISTQIFCGHLGNLDLAASALGNNGIQVFAYGLMVSHNHPSFSSSLLHIQNSF